MSDIIYPKIGELITTERAIELCRHFALQHLVERISAHPEQFRPWRYDGVSCVPDELLMLFTGRGHTWQDITNECALPHDLQYAYGSPGDRHEKYIADHDFSVRLVTKAGMKPGLAEMFRQLVERYGGEERRKSYSWGFARVAA